MTQVETRTERTERTERAENPAEFYERYMVPVIHGPLAADLVARVAPQPGERVLDVACGTGIVARTIAQALAGQVELTGIDISPLMLAVAREAARAEGAAITWHAGDATTLPFADGAFDLVLCQQALQLMPDMGAATREMHRVLVPGGRVAISAWTSIERNPFDMLVAQAFQRHVGKPVIDVAFALGDPAVFAGLVAEAGFVDIAIETHQVTARFPSADEYVELMVVGAVAAIPDYATMPEAEQTRLVHVLCDDIGARTQPFIDDGELVVVSETGILQARRPA
jgi:ubiquinone/menaquinone biosynthesis C-methylase UbiE